MENASGALSTWSTMEDASEGAWPTKEHIVGHAPRASTMDHIELERYDESDCLHPRCASPQRQSLSGSDISKCAQQAAQVIQEVVLSRTYSLVDRSILEDVVADNKARFHGCIMMPMNFIFFVLYIAAATLHEDIPTVHLLESPLRQRLVPPLTGLLTNQDVWGYINKTVLPTFFKQQNMYNESIPNWSDWSRVFTYNQLKGAMALEQVRSRAEPCDGSLSEHMLCYPLDRYSEASFGRNLTHLVGVNLSVLASPMEGFEIESEASRRLARDKYVDGSSHYRRLRVMREELARWMPPVNDEAKYTFNFFLYPSSPIAELEQRIGYLQRRGWLDDATARVTIKALVMNAETEPPRVENVKWHFAMSRGGGVFASMRFETLFLRAWNSATSAVVDAMFILMLMVQTAHCIYMASKAGKEKECKAHFKIPVNTLAWVNVTMSWLNVMGFFMQDAFRKEIIYQIELSHDAAISNTTTLSEFQERASELHKAADDMTSFTTWYRLFITYLNLLLMVRCFVMFEFQPRLAIVIATLKATSIDLCHFLVVFVPTFLAYAIAGMCIFGRRVEEFSSVTRSIGTCFKIAIESEYDWEKLSEEDFITSASWVWTFLLLIVLLMLNMVLAIIMDVYTEVRRAAGSSETVADNIRFLLKRIWYRKEWISDDKLLEVLAEMPRTLTGQELRQAFPKMTDMQYTRLMSAALSMTQTSMRTGQHDTCLAHMTSAIKVGLDRATRSLSRIKSEQEDTHLKRGRRPDKVCFEDIMQSVAVQNHWMTSVQNQLDALRTQMPTSELDSLRGSHSSLATGTGTATMNSTMGAFK